MSRLTDRYCPNCFRQLNEGVKDWYWCPDTYHCEYECDISKNDTTLSKSESLTGRRSKLEKRFEEVKASYERERDALIVEIDNLKSQEGFHKSL